MFRLIREIEFGEAAEANEDAINKLGETVQSLDRLLAEKNRRLQNDNAQLRQTNHRHQGGSSSFTFPKNTKECQLCGGRNSPDPM